MSDIDLPLAVRMMQDGYLMEIDALQAENAELRELVRDFYPFALGHAAKPWLAIRSDRMRELGVEA